MHKICLTGSSGFLGRSIAEELDRRGIGWTPFRNRLESATKEDIGSSDIVIHCAALTPSRSSEKEEYLRVNTDGTRRLTDLCKSAGGKRFVYVSSMGVKFVSHYAQS